MSDWLVLIKDVDTKPFLKAYNEAEKFETDITDRSTQGNNSKQYTIKTESITPLALLFHNYIKKIKGIGHRNFKNGNGWCVEGDKGSWHRTHNHSLVRADTKSGEGVACVLYLDVPQGDDRGEFFYLIHTEKETQLNCLMPNKGDLVIMPKTVWHGVYPQTSEGLRRTLNLDFSYA
tara:strand:- start:232 stop:759 length:528 start_codon:yes stop_codon:yes gene_type:complete